MKLSEIIYSQDPEILNKISSCINGENDLNEVIVYWR